MKNTKTISVREFATSVGFTTAYINELIKDGKLKEKYPNVVHTMRVGNQNLIVVKN